MIFKFNFFCTFYFQSMKTSIFYEILIILLLSQSGSFFFLFIFFFVLAYSLTECYSTHYTAIIDNMCRYCSYGSSSIDEYTCDGCYNDANNFYYRFKEIEATNPQKCISVEESGPSNIAPKNIFKDSDGIVKKQKTL